MSRAGGGAENPRYIGAHIDGRLHDYLVQESKRTGFNKRHIIERALYRDWERVHGEKRESD